MIRGSVSSPLVEIPVGAASFPDHVLQADLYARRVVIFSCLGDIDGGGFAKHERLNECFACEFRLHFRRVNDRVVGREGVGTEDDCTAKRRRSASAGLCAVGDMTYRLGKPDTKVPL